MSAHYNAAAYIADVATNTAPEAGHFNMGELLTPTNAILLAMGTIVVRAGLKGWQNLSKDAATLSDPGESNTDAYMRKQDPLSH